MKRNVQNSCRYIGKKIYKKDFLTVNRAHLEGRGTIVDVLGSRGARCVVKWDMSLPNAEFGGTTTTCAVGYRRRYTIVYVYVTCVCMQGVLLYMYV